MLALVRIEPRRGLRRRVGSNPELVVSEAGAPARIVVGIEHVSNGMTGDQFVTYWIPHRIEDVGVDYSPERGLMHILVQLRI